MTFQYLITTIKKTREEIIKLLDSTKIKGSFIVGNQLADSDSEDVFENDNYTILIINMKNKGTSLNRNTILKRASSDYVTFLDDDMYLDSNVIQEEIEKIVIEMNTDCIRFNIISDNSERAIKYLSKTGYITFKDLRSFGVCGEFYKRDCLIKSDLYFNESIGPGTDINHGEDTVYNHSFLKKYKIYQISTIVFHAKQEKSTWNGMNRNVEKEIYSTGYIYELIFGWAAYGCGVYHLTKHRNNYKNVPYFKTIKILFEGIKISKKRN